MNTPSTKYEALIDTALASALGKHLPSAIVLSEQLKIARLDLQKAAEEKASLEKSYQAKLEALESQMKSVREGAEVKNRGSEIVVGM